MSVTHDPRIPDPERCVLPYQLQRWARERPQQRAFSFHTGETWTWAETLSKTQRVASGLQALGVTHGDHVLSWQPNSPQALLTWFALNYLGAVYVPLNIAYRGALLEHVIALSDATLLVAHGDLAARLSEADTAALTDLVLCAGDVPVTTLRMTSFDDLLLADELLDMPAAVQPWDTQYIIFTSGTTGPSKAVLSSYLQGYAMGPEAHPYVDGDDCSLVNMPLFHAGGTIYVIMTLAWGGSAYVDDYFKTDSFWSTIRDNEVTSVCLVAAMIPFLLKLPPSEDDRTHTIKKALCIPWNDDARQVGERYGIEMRTCFNMTEISGPLVSEPFPDKAGTAGKVRPGVEARVVDEHDCEVPCGVTGELILRTDRPWSMNHGYYKNPEATALAWRNGWFHTGDGFRYDEDGNFFFVDRIKDAIRRRGENISSFEVENEVTAYDSVAEAAAIPVPSEYGEDEVMVVVAPVADTALEPLALFNFLQPRMAHFMLPRYIRVVDSLPKTPTQKVKKHELREVGVTADTWDREAAGIKIKRENIQA